MSDTAQGEGWWIASDGKWYPPETHPDYVAPFVEAPQSAEPPRAFEQPQSPVAAPEADTDEVAPAAIVGPAQSTESWSSTSSTQPTPSEEPYTATVGPGMPVAGAGPRPVGQSTTPTALQSAEPSFWQKPVMWAAAAVMALLAIGVGFLIGAPGDDNKVATNASSPDPTSSSSLEPTSTPRQSPTREPEPTAAPAAAPTEVPLEEPTTEQPTAEPPVVTMGDVNNCAIDDGSVVLSLVNTGTSQASYFIDLEYFDADGVAVGEDWASISYVLPGQAAVEYNYLYTEDDAVAATCSVLAVDRSVDPDSLALNQAECVATPDDSGELRADITVQNQSGVLSNYDVYVAVVDGEGVRVASGSTYVSLLDVDETGRSDAYLGPAAGLVGDCQVVFVDAYDESLSVFVDAGATDVSNCVISDDGSTATVSITSTGEGMRSYEPRVVYLDADGVRIDDDWLWQPMVLAGESLVGVSSIWSTDGAVTCEIRDVAVYEVEEVPALALDAATCEVNGTDIDVSLDTSTVESAIDFDVYVALLDDDGKRIDFAVAYFYDVADAASPMQETAYSSIDVEGVAECQVRFIREY